MTKKKKQRSEKEFVEVLSITHKFPWVSKEEYVAHYSRALAVYMEQSFPGSSKNHMTDLAASSSSFSDAWWAIFDNIDYE
jgi:hypothetical protein